MAGLFMKTVLLSLKVGAAASKTFTCTLKNASVDAKAGDTVEYPTLSAGCTYRQLGATTYELHLVGVQDFDPASPSGLAAYLDLNDGATAAFWFQAHGEAVAASTSTPAKSGTCVLTAPSYGGEVNNWAEYDVTLPISGKPATVTTGTAPAMLDALLAGDDELVAQLAGLVAEDEPTGKAKAA